MTKNTLRSAWLILLAICFYISNAQHARLHSTRIGSSGNLLTTNANNGNQISINEELNAVMFIHRNDPFVFGGNVATYRYDMSKDRGASWKPNISTSTDMRIDNNAVNGRFPQGLIYNPVGNTIVDSAYLVYSGTWHNGTDGWKGEMRGRGKLYADSTGFNVHIDSVNNGAVNIATGLCQGAPGVFWNVNQDYPAKSFVGGVSLITTGVIVEKGVWNPVKRDVDWTEQRLPVTFRTNSTGTATMATSFNIAFDPSGQYGWISCLGDITNDNETTLNPIFWKTTDGGITWSGPEQVFLSNMPEVVRNLNRTFPNGDPASGVPTTAFDADLAVDYLGNPHLLAVVGNATGDYSIQQARYDIWDFTYDAQMTHKWKGIYLSEVATLRGSLSNDNPAPQTQDNRPLVSRTADGKKIFFLWVDSDIDFIGADQNDLPNLFCRAVDASQANKTQVYNLTEGDSLWGAETATTPMGAFYGATFPVISPIAFSNNNDTYNIPLVLSQIDYNHDPQDGLGSYLNPVAFWYINNIDIPGHDFYLPWDLEGAVSLGLDKNVCNGSQIILTPLIGEPVPPYSYDWSYSGDIPSCLDCKNPSVTITQNSTYQLILTDGNGKEFTASVNYTLTGGSTNNISFSFSGTGIDCSNRIDTTTLTISNGHKPFTIAWGDGQSSLGLATQQHNYSRPGEYIVSVTDSLNCVTMQMDTVANKGVNVSSLQFVRPNCPEVASGKIKLAASGGVAPYTFSWSNGATADSITNLKAGRYFVTVNDANGCSTIEQYGIAPIGSWNYHVKLQTGNANCANNGGVNATVYQGRSPYSFLWSNNSTSQNIGSLSPGNYEVTVTDSLGCLATGTARIYSDCKSVISGIAFADTNHNCHHDATEYLMPNVYIQATNGSTGRIFYASTDANGFYTLLVSETGSYHIQADVYNHNCGTSLLCDNTQQQVVVSVLGDTSTGNNFAYLDDPQFDLTVFPMWTRGNPGFSKTYSFYPYNSSYYPFTDYASVTFNYDSNLVYQSSIPPAIHNAQAHTLTWTLSSVTNSPDWWGIPGVHASFMVPLSVSLSTILYSEVSIVPDEGDCHPLNNRVPFSELVTGSYDPNEKEVSPSKNIYETDSVLTYTIHFQNTGTDSTHFVVVTDTLPPQLDPATVVTIAASHPYSTFNMKDRGTLTWVFDPLRLVDSITDPVNSKGFVKFTVKKKPNLPIGTTIQNHASIYFDYNTPVVTNTTSDTMSIPLSLTEVSVTNGIAVTAFPNPFSKYTTIAVQGIAESYDFEVYDVTGKVSRKITSIIGPQFRFDRGNFASGIYFYRIETATGKRAFGKLILE